jgi:hypothetical protein
MNSKRIDSLIAVIAVVAAMAAALAHLVKSRTTHIPSRASSKGPSIMKKKWIQVGLVLTALVAVATASVGVTLALYSNRPSGETNTFASGTVSLTNVVTGACLASTNNMAPGDTGTCTLATTYGGTLSGYMALDVFIATQKSTTAGGAGATDLYNPSDATYGEEITVSGATPSVNYVVAGGTTNFGTAITCPSSGTSLDGNSYTTYDKCYLLSNILVSATAFASGSVTFTTGITLQNGEPNTYQGSSAVVVLSAHAVQSKNNVIDCVAGAFSPTAGAVCTPAGSFAWS